MLPKAKVLFLCTGNSARSQMGEALLRRYAGAHFDVYSGGLEPKGLNPYTVRVLEEIGVDVSAHHSKGLGEYLGRVNFGYLITVCSEAEKNCPIFPGVSVRLHWPFEDPAKFEGRDEEILVKFRQVRDQIDARIGQWLAEMNIQARESDAR